MVLTAVAFACELAMAFGILPPRASVVSGVVLLLAFVAFTPFFLIPLVRFLGGFVPSRWRIEGRLAVAQIVRQPIRTALTAGVLVVAVSNGIGLGHAIRDSVDDVLGWYARMLKADWVLTQAGALSVSRQDRGAASRAMQDDVGRLDGVADVEGIGVATGRISGQACVVIARDLPAGLPLPLAPVDATEADVRAALERGEAVAGTVLAQRTGLKAGDAAVVEVFGRKTPIRIAALVVDYTSGGASLVLRRDAARRLFGMEAADVLLVTAAEGRAASLRDPLEVIARSHSMFLRSYGDLRGFIDRIVSGVVGSLWSILGLGFVVGSLGVANTVTMSVLEQQRSLGLLRAVGMRRGQVVGLVVLQSMLLGAAAGIIGLVSGVTTALFIQFASQPLLGHPLAMHIRPGVVIANLLAALAVTALAAWLPARRAVKLELLEALSTE
jgi:putative ABC transport system permease protein